MLSRTQLLLRAALCLAPLTALLVWLLAAQPFNSSEQTALFLKWHRNTFPDWKTFFTIITDYGNLAMYPVYAAILVTGLKKRRKDLTGFALAYIAVQLVISFGLVQVLKIFLGCPRPGDGWLCLPMNLEPSHHSLPSGHTTEIVAAVLPLALRWGNAPLALILGLLAAAVGWSRIYLGWHYPPDVAFGLLLGCWAGCAIYAFSPKENHEPHQ